MKIPGADGFIKSTISKTGSKETRKADTNGSKVASSEKTTSQESSAEKVLLSAKARDIAKISEIVKSSPDVRTEKIERIKNEIAEGTYSVDGQKIAENILKEILSESAFLE